MSEFEMYDSKAPEESGAFKGWEVTAPQPWFNVDRTYRIRFDELPPTPFWKRLSSALASAYYVFWTELRYG